MRAWISRRVLAHEHVGCLPTQSMNALVLWAGNPYKGENLLFWLEVVYLHGGNDLPLA